MKSVELNKGGFGKIFRKSKPPSLGLRQPSLLLSLGPFPVRNLTIDTCGDPGGAQRCGT